MNKVMNTIKKKTKVELNDSSILIKIGKKTYQFNYNDIHNVSQFNEDETKIRIYPGFNDEDEEGYHLYLTELRFEFDSKVLIEKMLSLDIQPRIPNYTYTLGDAIYSDTQKL